MLHLIEPNFNYYKRIGVWLAIHVMVSHGIANLFSWV